MKRVEMEYCGVEQIEIGGVINENWYRMWLFWLGYFGFGIIIKENNAYGKIEIWEEAACNFSTVDEGRFCGRAHRLIAELVWNAPS